MFLAYINKWNIYLMIRIIFFSLWKQHYAQIPLCVLKPLSGETELCLHVFLQYMFLISNIEDVYPLISKFQVLNAKNVSTVSLFQLLFFVLAKIFAMIPYLATRNLSSNLFSSKHVSLQFCRLWPTAFI